MEKERLVKICNTIIDAYKTGKLGQTMMPEDEHPEFSSQEEQLSYFTLPMALNYQRDSYKLWEAALKTFNDPETNFVFTAADVVRVTEEETRKALMKYKLALQPNKHISTWRSISKTVHENWGSFEKFIEASNEDFVILKQLVQNDFKKEFPYLSGPKIFNYWSFIISTYGKVHLKNRNQIDIAPDTHITQCSVRIGVITQEQAEKLSKEQISEIWRERLSGSDIDPIDMHPPLWFWSRNGFIFEP